MNIEGSRSGPIYAGTAFTLIATLNFNKRMPIDVYLLLVTSWRNEDGHVLQDDMEVIASNGRGQQFYLIYSPIHTTDSGRVSATVTFIALNESLQMYIYPVNTLASAIINVTGKTPCSLSPCRSYRVGVGG